VNAHGHAEVLVNAVDGVALGFTDDLAIDRQGHTIYFSDASSKFGWGHDRDDVLEHGGHGRLLSYDVGSGQARTLLSGLQFANGVALGPDDAYVLVNETGAYRITRLWLKGPKAGTRDIFVDNLPGFPDNITFNGHDRFWVALFAQRDAIVDALAPHPALRCSVARLLALVPAPIPAHAIALAYDTQSHLIANLQASGRDAYFPVTSVLEAGSWLYFGSLTQQPIGRMSLDAALRDNAP
jgi:sugar lactone lactonase YvrE